MGVMFFLVSENPTCYNYDLYNYYEFRGVIYEVKKTSLMTEKEFQDVCFQIEMWAYDFLGIDLSEPQDYQTEQELNILL